MPGKMEKAVLTAEEFLWSLCKAFFGPGKIEKAIFIMVEML